MHPTAAARRPPSRTRWAYRSLASHEGRRAACGVAHAVSAAVAISLAACGADDAPFPVATGSYHLTTLAIEGDCRLDNALGPGPAMLGQTIPVEVTASSVGIEVAVCGHAAEDPRCGGAGDAFDFGLARDDNAVTGSQLWLVPGCGDAQVEAALRAEGDVSAPSTLTIVWSATISAANPAWTCAGFAPCGGTVRQQLAPIVTTTAPNQARDDLRGVVIRPDARHAGHTYDVMVTEAMQPGGSSYERLNTHPRAAFYDAFLTPFSNAPQAWLKRIIAGAK